MKPTQNCQDEDLTYGLPGKLWILTKQGRESGII